MQHHVSPSELYPSLVSPISSTATMVRTSTVVLIAFVFLGLVALDDAAEITKRSAQSWKDGLWGRDFESEKQNEDRPYDKHEQNTRLLSGKGGKGGFLNPNFFANRHN